MKSPELAGIRARIFVSAGCRLDFRGRFGAFVSALQNRVSPRQRPVVGGDLVLSLPVVIDPKRISTAGRIILDKEGCTRRHTSRALTH
jgi:hypothetical protein